MHRKSLKPTIKHSTCSHPTCPVRGPYNHLKPTQAQSLLPSESQSDSEQIAPLTKAYFHVNARTQATRQPYSAVSRIRQKIKRRTVCDCFTHDSNARERSDENVL